jgi:hypothetical protein
LTGLTGWTGLGRIDILLTYQGRKYIVETKINRSSLERTAEKAIDQLCGKYLLTERANEGYVVIFDPKTTVGELQQRAHSPQLVGATRRSRPSGAAGLANESEKMTEFLTVEDSLQLAAGFFHYARRKNGWCKKRRY